MLANQGVQMLFSRTHIDRVTCSFVEPSSSAFLDSGERGLSISQRGA